MPEGVETGARVQVTTFAVNYKGKPFMEPLSSNRGLAISLGAAAAVLGAAAYNSVGDQMTVARVDRRGRHAAVSPTMPRPSAGTRIVGVSRARAARARVAAI